MALLKILEFPDLRLKKMALPVEVFDESLATLVEDMFETLYKTDAGVGLAATQVNVAKRVIVIDISEEHNQPRCLINPEIIHRDNEVESEEACLSFPGIYAKIKRSKEITLKYFDKEGKSHQENIDGFLSICVQHEIDHLNGITYYDHLAPVKQHMLRKKMEKYRKRMGELNAV